MFTLGVPVLWEYLNHPEKKTEDYNIAFRRDKGKGPI